MTDDVERGVALRLGVIAGSIQMDLTFVVPERESEIILDHKLDNFRRVLKRQRALESIPPLRAKIAAEMAGLQDRQAALVAMDERFSTLAEQRARDVAKLRDRRGVLHNEFVEEWRASGKRGEFEARGMQKSKLLAFDQSIANIETAHANSIQEDKIARSRIDNEVLKLQRSIEISERALADFEALARGENTDELGVAEFEGFGGIGESANDA